MEVFKKMTITKNMPLNWYSSKQKIEKNTINFWHGIFLLPFDAEGAEKFLNVIYYYKTISRIYEAYGKYN